ncbi:LuxR C-terminal-related transcriptional regulator [Paenibacillus harenae]|uniref:DNA-binding CsgD family transcriptional regulator n=1 Tax=Paenibacillus harenae TaxID=306543 RepID=A0ABT9TVH8_PAEHA|nr:LuxR C-terminal-related transcriptional regulator [Paenibacillus harenae]MDQ0111087.1 DNA-binding CsgD family transcriptional regulator [Paenibacillus harenae]
MTVNEIKSGDESLYVVGRERELAAFQKELDGALFTRKIMNLHGTAGIGKSFLLDEFHKRAHACGVIPFTIDCESFAVTPQGFCLHVLNLIHPRGYNAASDGELMSECVEALNGYDGSKRVVLLFDAYERMESLDHWLRDYFLKQLKPHILTVVAGRTQLAEPWFLSPSWRQQIIRMPLAELDFEAVERYAGYSGVNDKELIARLWRYSKGHPLTLSLVTFILEQAHLNGEEPVFSEHDTLPYLVDKWLQEVPDEELRSLIEAASVLRHFNQDSLSFLMDYPVSSAQFYRLIRFSFVRKVERGWTLHGLMREALSQELIVRAPMRYKALREKGLLYYYGRLKENETFEASPREAVELMYYIGDALVRALMNWFDLIPPRFEQAGRHTILELERYIERRRYEARDARIELFDPHSGRTFDFVVTAEQTCLTLKYLDFEKLFELGYDVVRIMRDAEGEIIGFAVVIPINGKTLPYLLESPRSRTYFSQLVPERLKQLAVSESTRAGWFIETIDIADFADAGQQTAMGHLLHALIFTGELVIESPAPIPFFIEAHKSLGFEVVPNATHREYDGITDAPTFVIDMRKNNLLTYIHRMMESAGQSESLVMEAEQLPEPGIGDAVGGEAPVDPILIRTDLTPREKEVAKLLEQGLKNAEIAERLYLSEATVKKHMKSMLAKLNAANRTQLLKKLLEQP